MIKHQSDDVTVTQLPLPSHVLWVIVVDPYEGGPHVVPDAAKLTPHTPPLQVGVSQAVAGPQEPSVVQVLPEPLVQTPLTHDCPLLQTFPHAPQFEGSLCIVLAMLGTRVPTLIACPSVTDTGTNVVTDGLPFCSTTSE